MGVRFRRNLTITPGIAWSGFMCFLHFIETYPLLYHIARFDKFIHLLTFFHFSLTCMPNFTFVHNTFSPNNTLLANTCTMVLRMHLITSTTIENDDTSACGGMLLQNIAGYGQGRNKWRGKWGGNWGRGWGGRRGGDRWSEAWKCSSACLQRSAANLI